MWTLAAVQLLVLLGAFGASRITRLALRRVLSIVCGFWMVQNACASLLMPSIGLCLIFFFIAGAFGFACRVYWPRRVRVTA